MAKNDSYGSDGSVEGEAYCMKSMQKSNVDMVNQADGRFNMADLANNKKFPVAMVGSKVNEQEDAKAGSGKYDY
jgi:hypothetical protein